MPWTEFGGKLYFMGVEYLGRHEEREFQRFEHGVRRATVQRENEERETAAHRSEMQSRMRGQIAYMRIIDSPHNMTEAAKLEFRELCRQNPDSAEHIANTKDANEASSAQNARR
jgi:hypothetical protein